MELRDKLTNFEKKNCICIPVFAFVFNFARYSLVSLKQQEKNPRLFKVRKTTSGGRGFITLGF